MGRRWNRVKATIYTRFSWINEAYVRWARARWTDRIPLPDLAAPLPQVEATVALLTSGGVHLSGHEPFDMHNPEGDASVRTVPGDADLDDLVITHDYYDHSATDHDLNCVFPLDRLRELAAAGVIGGVCPECTAQCYRGSTLRAVHSGQPSECPECTAQCYRGAARAAQRHRAVSTGSGVRRASPPGPADGRRARGTRCTERDHDEWWGRRTPLSLEAT
jgi:hypothetical protein